MRSRITLLSCAVVSLASAMASDSLTRTFWQADPIVWGDGRPFAKPVKEEGPYPQGFKATFNFDVPETGWYEVLFPNTKGDGRHDLVVDEKVVWRNRSVAPSASQPDDAKAGNIWLTKGPHTFRIERVGLMGFPVRVFGGLALRPAEGSAEVAITGAKTKYDVMRAGEDFVVEITGGGLEKEVSYDLFRSDLAAPKNEPVKVGSVRFPASKEPKTETVKIPCPAEGAFFLSAKTSEGRDLLRPEFPIGEYAVVDVKNSVAGNGELERIYEIDCVAQTNFGKPLPEGMFREVNGPTTVIKKEAGAYRESHDCTAPGAEPMQAPDDPHSFSGFSYTIDFPELQVPYLIDVEYPDDDRRSVTVVQSWIDPATGEFAKGARYGGKGFETGGLQPLTNKNQHSKTVVWATSPKLVLGILSQQTGHRAAAAKITVSRFKDGLVPIGAPPVTGGRTFAYWYEEAGNWEHLVNVGGQFSSTLVRDVVGLDRWARLSRFFGLNGISACGVGYQQAFWRNTTLPGFGTMPYDQARLTALICEKYGLAFIPEVYPTQWYMNLVGLPALAENPDDVRSISSHGSRKGPGSAPTDLNALHPAVQDMWLGAFGELSDKLRDSPAFKGITVRADGWGFRGDFTLPGLNWGYGDWTVRLYEKETGVKVPDAETGEDRFIKRFEFLTSEPQREKWLAWRAAKVLDYHKRLRDRIRGDREDLYFGVAGDFRCDISYQIPDSITERALDCGVDLAKMHEEEGLLVIPYARYGRRNMGMKAQQDYDDFLDRENVRAGMGVMRGFSAYMTYNELGHYWPAEKFGIKVAPRKAPYYCSASIAAGRNSLEKFAVVLAEQDSAFLRDGGNTDIGGDPAIWKPWFREFESIPALPFTPLEGANDPVAVWYREVKGSGKDGFYFYAVNREQYPVTVELQLDGAQKLVSLGSGEEKAISGGKLLLELEPYDLKAFRAPAGAQIAQARTTVPAEQLEAGKDRLAFAQDLRQRLSQSAWQDVLEPAAKAAFLRQLDAAWQAQGEGSPWRARVALSMSPALAAYEAMGKLPEGQIVTAFPNLFTPRPNEGHWKPRRPVMESAVLKNLVVGPGEAVLKTSTELNKMWGGAEVLMARDGVLEFDLDVPADGRYALKVGQVALTPGVTVVSVDGRSLPVPMETGEPRDPETFAFPAVELKPGKVRLTLRRDGEFGVYALQLLAPLKPMPSSEWSTVGPFQASWGLEGSGGKTGAGELRRGLETPFIPEDKVDIEGIYRNRDGVEVKWTQKSDSSVGDLNDAVIAMPSRTRSSQYDVNYAVCFITSDADRIAQLDLAVDWWGVAWLNGQRLKTKIDPKLQEECGGADFTSWYPYTTYLPLKKGVNTLLVKQHGGSLGSSIAAYISDEPGITCSALPPQAGNADGKPSQAGPQNQLAKQSHIW